MLPSSVPLWVVVVGFAVGFYLGLLVMSWLQAAATEHWHWRE